MSKAGRRIGTAMRGNMQDAYDKRGSALATLYSSYSLKCRMDVVPSTDLQFLHFLWCESEPAVAKVSYRPTSLLRDRLGETGYTCEVVTAHGVLELRRLRYSRRSQPSKHMTEQAEACAAEFRRLGKSLLGRFMKVEIREISDQDFIPGNEILLRNWQRLLSRYALTRNHSLEHAKRLVLARLASSDGPVSLFELLEMSCPGAESGLILSALIESNAFGECLSDLGAVDWSMRTNFYRR